MKLIFRAHAIQRMFERQITAGEVRQAIRNGKTIADYPHDKPFPSKLILGWVADRPIHVVIAEEPSSGNVIVITVYEPDPTRWDETFEKRRK